MKHLFNFIVALIVFVAWQIVPAASALAQLGTHTKIGPAGTNSLYYWEYLPPGYNTATQYPMIIFLHGIGERSDPGEDRWIELDSLTVHGPPREIERGNKDMCFSIDGGATTQCFIVLSPQAHDNATWGSGNVSNFVQYAIQRYNPDPSRVYVTGLSMGGIGTLKYAQSGTYFATSIAAIAVAAGGSPDIDEACDLPANDVSVWAVHGEKDRTPQTLPGPMDDFIDAINACTSPPPVPKAYLYMIPDASHNVWSSFYKTDNSSYNPNVYQWFLKNPKGASNTTPNQGPKLKFFDANDALITTGTITVASASVLITGTAADYDGDELLLAGSTTWTKVSGPAVTMTLGGNNAARTLTVSGMTHNSDYRFRLASSDSENKSSTKEIVIKCRITSGNIPPEANAGADKSINLPATTVTLIGTATDADGTIASYLWEQDPTDQVQATIVNPSSATTNVTGLTEGVFNFSLTATDDDGAPDTDHVIVTVGPEVSGDDSWLELTSNSISGKRIELYASNAKSNSVQRQVRTGGNDYLQLYLQPKTGTPQWSSLQIGLNVAFQNKYVNVLNSYIQETGDDGWTRIHIPLADFGHDAERWSTGGVSNVGIKIVSGFGTGTIVFGVDEIQFVGSATPYVWYGDTFESSGDDDHVFTLDGASFAISSRYATGGVADAIPPGGGWLKMTSETAAAGKRIELYRDATRSNGVQENVRTGGNDYLEFRYKLVAGSPNWSNFQIGMVVSFQNKYVNVLSTYIKETTDGWTRVEIPVADFGHDASRWTNGGVSNIGFKTLSGFGSGTIVFGIDEVKFVGGTTPFVWYGDEFETSGTAPCVFTLDNLEFYISERPTEGGVDNSGSLFAMMTAGKPNSEEPAAEQPEVFTISIYDRYGQFIGSFEHHGKRSELDNLDYTPFVNQKGMFMFKIANRKGAVTSEKIVFKD